MSHFGFGALGEASARKTKRMRNATQAAAACSAKAEAIIRSCAPLSGRALCASGPPVRRCSPRVPESGPLGGAESSSPESGERVPS